MYQQQLEEDKQEVDSEFMSCQSSGSSSCSSSCDADYICEDINSDDCVDSSEINNYKANIDLFDNINRSIEQEIVMVRVQVKLQQEIERNQKLLVDSNKLIMKKLTTINKKNA